MEKVFCTGILAIICLVIGILIGIFFSGVAQVIRDDKFNSKGEYECTYDSDQPDGVYHPKGGDL